MSEYTKYKAIKTLIGSLESIGETNSDERVYNNLCELETIIFPLLSEISDESRNADRHEHSMSKNGKKAKSMLAEIKEYCY